MKVLFIVLVSIPALLVYAVIGAMAKGWYYKKHRDDRKHFLLDSDAFFFGLLWPYSIFVHVPVKKVGLFLWELFKKCRDIIARPLDKVAKWVEDSEKRKTQRQEQRDAEKAAKEKRLPTARIHHEERR